LVSLVDLGLKLRPLPLLMLTRLQLRALLPVLMFVLLK
jgi:hypothetical protein